MLAPTLISTFLIAPALACPTIATGTPSELSFDVAQVAIARQDNRTTFSVSINPAGPSQPFALVLPVPEILEEHEIETLDPEIFGRLNGYSAPRHVDDAGCGYGSSPSADGSASDSGSAGGGTGTVVVEAEYLVGEYLIVILSAKESGNLQTWLDANGYYLPTGAEPRLQEYIDAGSFFLAAKVADEAAVADGSQLSPLKLSYDSEIFSIPIRLATLNSPGHQDMVIYALTAMEGNTSGRAGVSNYTEFEVVDKCIWGEATDDFSEFYEERFAETWAALDDAGWTVEYAGSWGDCNPCSSVVITEEDVAALGFDERNGSHHLTRIRMRYTPEQATQDLTLYGSGIYEPDVAAFADDNAWNRSCVELCDAEPGTSGGTSGSTSGGSTTSSGGSTGGTVPGGGDTAALDEGEVSGCGGGRGCATAGGGGSALLLGLALIGLRRRES